MKPNIDKNNLAKPIFYLFLVGCLFCFQIEAVDAHRVNLFAWVEGDTVYVESKFSGGKKVKAGKIIVSDPQGTELLKGTTNENGEFSFKVPKKTIPLAEIQMPAAVKKPVPPKSPGIKEVIIGIVCILGLTGIAAYIRKRRKKA